MNTISVIGGSGFVGTNLCKYFKEKNINFEIIDIKKSNQFQSKSKICDIRNLEKLRKTISGEIIINLAAVHRDDIVNKDEYYSTNVEGAKNLVKVCEEKGIKKIIFTSTVAVYGFAKPGTNENGAIKPFNDYGKSKYQAELIYKNWQFKNNHSLIIVRPTVIFGEGNRGNVFNLINQIHKKNFIMISNGRNKKSLAYIKNIVLFLYQCCSFNIPIGIYNYVDTPDLDMNSFIKIVNTALHGKNKVGIRLPYWFGLLGGYFFDFLSTILNKKFSISSIRIKKFCASTQFSTQKNKVNGFRSKYKIKDALLNTIESEFINPDPKTEIFFTE